MRLSLGAALVVLLATIAIATVALKLMRTSVKASIESEELARLSAIADTIDQKFVGWRTLLQTFASGVEAAGFADPTPLAAYLERHGSLRRAFGNVAIFTAEGDRIASLDGARPEAAVNILDRPYFRETLAAKAGVLSEPYLHRLSGRPQIALTQPVFDEAGAVRFVISAAIDLGGRNILGEMAGTRFGETGYLFIVDTEGVVIDHPRTEFIANPAALKATGSLEIERPVQQYEGIAEGLNHAGVHGMYAFKRIPQTNWVIGAMYPTAEAFAHFESIERTAWIGAVLLAAMAGALALAVVHRQLDPLRHLHRHMLDAENLATEPAVQPDYARDEIGDLRRTFDTLMLQRRASEKFLRDITDNLPAMISHVDAGGRYTFANAQVRMLYGGKEMVGRPMAEIRGPGEYARVAPAYARALAGHAAVLEKNGDPKLGLGDRTFKAHYMPDIDANGTVQGVFSMTFDITDEVNIRRALTEQQKRLRDVTDNIPALVGYFDNDENCLFGNVRARQMAGLGSGPLDGVTLRSAVGHAVYTQLQPYLPMVREGKAVRFPVRAPLHGKTGYFQVNLIPDRNLDAEVTGFYLMTFNITALKRAELRQAESERRLRTITDNLPALITYIDRDEKITFANATYRDWLGVEPTAILGRHVRDVAGPELYLSRKAMIARALAGERLEFEARTRTADADRVTRVSYVPDVGPDGGVRGIFSLSLDISALKDVERKLTELARVDTLTGLANRLAFNELLPGAVARAQRTGLALAVMFLDIDHFKRINDTLGHATGDAVLVEYAKRLKAGVRSTDTVARLAGDEFVVVLENLHMREDAVATARKIVQQVGSAPFQLEGRSLHVTTSIGVAFHRGADAAVEPSVLLARADAALYRAKSAGRNTFGFSDG